MEIKNKFPLPKVIINKKIQRKYLQDMPFSEKKKHNFSNTNTSNSKNKKEITNETKYRSNIIKKIKKNENNEVISENLDYSSLNQSYIDNIKKNLDK